MILSSMQPYLFPYIGYFQLINVADRFIIYDNAQYIKKGWINRNRVLVNGKPDYFIFSLRKDSYTAKINERIFRDMGRDKKEFFKKIFLSYKRAPYFNEVNALIEEIFSCDEENLAKFIIRSLHYVCGYLNIDTPIIIESEMELGVCKDRNGRIFEKNHLLGTDIFINPIGGMELYSKKDFAKEEIELKFLKVRDIKYKQFGEIFVPNLSIIDVMMFNSKERIAEMLQEFDLI